MINISNKTITYKFGYGYKKTELKDNNSSLINSYKGKIAYLNEY